VVRSFRPAWAEGAGWRIDPQPALSIGVEAGDDVYQFYSPSAALRLPDGTVVVSDPGKGELFFYDAEGRFLHRAGGRGQGPGEFGRFGIMWMWLDGTGRVVADDTPGSRAHVYRPDGELDETVMLQATAQGGRANLVGVLGDDTWVAVAREDTPPSNDAGQVIRSSLRYVRYRDGVYVNDVATADYRPRYVHEWGGRIDRPFIPFTRAPLEAAAAGRLYLVAAGDPRVEVFEPDGAAAARFILAGLARRRVSEVWERWRDEELADFEEGDPRTRQAHFLAENLPLPELVPSHDKLLVDGGGNLWLRRYQLPWETGKRWDVIGPSGRWLGAVATPDSFVVYQIAERHLVGLHWDEAGVFRVRLYRIHES